jgi:hypothetical protein
MTDVLKGLAAKQIDVEDGVVHIEVWTPPKSNSYDIQLALEGFLGHYSLGILGMLGICPGPEEALFVATPGLLRQFDPAYRGGLWLPAGVEAAGIPVANATESYRRQQQAELEAMRAQNPFLKPPTTGREKTIGMVPVEDLPPL